MLQNFLSNNPIFLSFLYAPNRSLSFVRLFSPPRRGSFSMPLVFLRLAPRLSPLLQSCMYRAASSANAAARRACRYGLLLPQLLQKFPLLTVPQLQVQSCCGRGDPQLPQKFP